MVAIKMQGATSASLVQQLLAQQTIIKDHYARLRDLRTRIANREVQFGIPSADVHQAIDDGRIDETYEVTKWLMDIDLLERVERAGQ